MKSGLKHMKWYLIPTIQRLRKSVFRQMPKESTITTAIKHYLIAQGFVVLKIHGGPYQDAGWPDLLGIRDGQAWLFEVKTPTGKVSKLQANKIEELRSVGAKCFVVRSRDEVKEILEREEE